MKSLLLLITAFITISSFGQGLIKGNISDPNETLPFAKVLIKHSTKGVYADLDGNFTIEAKPTDTLQISYLGYKSKDILVGKQNDFKIVLNDYEELNEVVVIAYGVHTICRSMSCCGVRVSSETIERLGENEKIKATSIKLYPNPSKDGIYNIKSSNDFSEVNVVVADLTGRVILNKLHEKMNSNIMVDLSNQPSGIYIINLSTKGIKMASKKAIRL